MKSSPGGSAASRRITRRPATRVSRCSWTAFDSRATATVDADFRPHHINTRVSSVEPRAPLFYALCALRVGPAHQASRILHRRQHLDDVRHLPCVGNRSTLLLDPGEVL